MNKSNRRVKGLGEVSIQVRDLDVMHKFYEEVVGLEVLRRDDDERFVFFKVAEAMEVTHRISPSLKHRTH